MSRIVAANEDGITEAVDALRRGEPIGLPTETVYGLAADATNEDAVRRIFATKGRPVDHPLIVHVADASELLSLAVDVTDACRVLVEHAWPGPLTVVVRARSSVSRIVTGGRDTVAVRCPAHETAREIIRRLGRPLAAPSANRFGHVSPTTARHVADDLGVDVGVIVDGGDCEIGVESTIVDCTLATVEILRPGSITADDIARLLEPLGVAVSADSSGAPRAPGMLAAHYAPKAQVVLHEDRSTVPGDAVCVLDCSTNMVEAARTLYSRLRDADAAGHSVIHAILPPARGLGHALRDRLVKAAAGR